MKSELELPSWVVVVGACDIWTHQVGQPIKGGAERRASGLAISALDVSPAIAACGLPEPVP